MKQLTILNNLLDDFTLLHVKLSKSLYGTDLPETNTGRILNVKNPSALQTRLSNAALLSVATLCRLFTEKLVGYIICQ